MNSQIAAVDYRKLTLSNINSPEYRHLKLLLYWPIYGLAFMYLERFSPVTDYFPMHCALDDWIPFCELFVIPYLLWFVALFAIHAYTLFYDVETFKKLMKFIIITYSISTVIYFIFPNCQNLRPEEFARDNIFTRFMAMFYQFDTNTNVFPSLHVVGSVAVALGTWYAKGLQKRWIKVSVVILAVLISISTVFLKQHSALDILGAIIVCLVAYPFSFYTRKTNNG